MIRTAFKAASNAGLLPAVGWLLLGVAVLALGAGLYAGSTWQKGRSAIADNARLNDQARADRKTIADLVAAGRALQQHGVDSALEYRQASVRMALIAARLEDTLDANRDFAARQQDALADLLARRPDLRTLDLGPDVLRHWNASNAGAAAQPAAAPAAARPAGQPAPAVPGAAAGAQQPGVRPAGQPRRSGRAVPGLSSARRLPAASRRRVAAHGVGLVLQRGGSTRPRRIGVPA